MNRLQIFHLNSFFICNVPRYTVNCIFMTVFHYRANYECGWTDLTYARYLAIPFSFYLSIKPLEYMQL